MKILIVHNYYREPGGEDECVRAEANLLEEHGHEVVRFSIDNAAMRPDLGSAARGVWSRESHATLRRLIERERPQVAHFHNTFYRISPSGYWAAAAQNVPVVQTLHNYRLLCCNALLFRDGKPCEDCVGKRIPWHGVARACFRGSVTASLAVATGTALHRALGTWRDRIDVYVAPSEFACSRFLAAGFPATRIVVKPNFVHPDPGVGSGDGGFALFAGRLSADKGVGTLLDAWRSLPAEIPLRIVGDGPMADYVARAAEQSRVEWLGQRPHAEVLELMGRARCIVVPSECYETFGRVAVEAFAKGTPVVVSATGAAANLVSEGLTGFHFRPGDSTDLACAVRRIFSADLGLTPMRQRARLEYESKYTGAVNYEMLMAIYGRAIAARSARPLPLGTLARALAESGEAADA